MTFKGFIAFEFLVFTHFPKFDGHVSGATGQIIPRVIKVQVIDHAGMLPKGLLAFSRFIVPNFDTRIF
jgi:hypothetical protein